MNIITYDYESFWSQTYSLSHLSPLEYVMGDEFELISCAIKNGTEPTQVLFGEEDVRYAFSQLDVAGSMLLAHNNSGFDAYISAYRLGLNPKLWGCTLAMARPIHAKDVGLSLGALVRHYNLGVKDNRVLMATKGKHLCDFTQQELEDMRTYNGDDADQCRALFGVLVPHFTSSELWQIDALTRMRTEPQFVVDTGLLETALSVERSNKYKALLDTARLLGIERTTSEEEILENVRATLASSARFGELLQARGVSVPMKVSPTDENKRIPALAKTDQGFLDLQKSEDPVVATAARARLAIKSTLLETRIGAHLTAASLAGGRLPVPLRYCGADTTGRDSGEEYNCQNEPRIDPDRPKVSDALRNSKRAPPGHKIVVADQSGIELRVNHTLWKVESSMKLWAGDPKADLYRAFAALQYSIPAADVSKSQRQLAKVAQLGLGFGAGVETFRRVAKIMGGLDLSLVWRPLEQAEIDELVRDSDDYVFTMDAEGYPITIDHDPAQKVVDDWRRIYHQIVEGWRTCHDALDHIQAGRERNVDPWGLIHTCKEGLRGPTGRVIRYPDLRRVKEPGTGRWEWWYAQGRHKARIYAGKIDENCLAEGTLVLTQRGAVPIERVRRADLVHDGVEFVAHAGTIFKSVQPCVAIDGVHMTPDHEVLTDEGWKAASQKPEPYRPDLRYVDGAAPRTQRRSQDVLALPLRVREPVREGGERRDEGSQAAGHPELRVRLEAAGGREEPHAWHEQASSLRSVARNARSLPTAIASSMEELRRAWHRSVRRVGGFVRNVLASHGADVLSGVGAGPEGQRGRVFQEQLPMGNSTRAGDEQANQRARGGHPSDFRCDGNQQVDAVLPSKARASPRRVYDIINCGPRHRFVVLGDSGPFIVHNCVQFLARDSIFDATVETFKRTGLRPAMRVHDELVYAVPEGIAEDFLATLQGVLRTPPKWWPELVVWSEGDVADTYGAAK